MPLIANLYAIIFFFLKFLLRNYKEVVSICGTSLVIFSLLGANMGKKCESRRVFRNKM